MEHLDSSARSNNYAILRDCLAEPLILKSAPPAPSPLLHNNSSAKGGKKKPRGSGRSSALDRVVSKKKKVEDDQRSDDDDAEELAEFVDVNEYLTLHTPHPGSLVTD